MFEIFNKGFGRKIFINKNFLLLEKFPASFSNTLGEAKGY